MNAFTRDEGRSDYLVKACIAKNGCDFPKGIFLEVEANGFTADREIMTGHIAWPHVPVGSYGDELSAWNEKFMQFGDVVPDLIDGDVFKNIIPIGDTIAPAMMFHIDIEEIAEGQRGMASRREAMFGLLMERSRDLEATDGVSRSGDGGQQCARAKTKLKKVAGMSGLMLLLQKLMHKLAIARVHPHREIGLMRLAAIDFLKDFADRLVSLANHLLTLITPSHRPFDTLSECRFLFPLQSMQVGRRQRW